MKNNTFVFSSPRKKNYKNKTVQAKDFYYGIFNPSFNEKNINIIEFEKSNNITSFILSKLDYLFTKTFSLPFYTAKLTNFNNLKLFNSSKNIFLINENVGCSAILLLFFTKKNIRINLFVMGLYSKKLKFNFLKRIHYLLILILVNNVSNVLFLGKAEYQKAKLVHKNKSEKFMYFPFSVDTDFWTPNTSFDLSKNNYILFVGNDGNRNSELLIEIANKLPQYNFIFISKIPNLQNIKLVNVNHINGSWADSELNDNDLKNIYNNARLTILPLKESTQPSGQSVAMQSMSIGVPVIISKTSGFWDSQKFYNDEHIIFEELNTLDSWVQKINSVYDDLDMLNKISKQGRELILTEFNLEKFYNRLDKLIN